MYLYQAPIALVARPKLHGPGQHVGVRWLDGSVLHRTPQGTRQVSFEEFAQGRPVHVVKQAKITHYLSIWERLKASLAQPARYDLVDRNCEHFAYEIIDGAPKSPQIATVAALTAVAAVAYAFA